MAEKGSTSEKSAQSEKKIEHSNIFSALSALQGELQPLDKTAEVEFATRGGQGKVSFKYTPLGEIMKALYPLLAKHGLSVRHEIVKKDQKDHIEAILTHETYKKGVVKEAEMEMEGEPARSKQVKFAVDEENILRSGPVRIYQGDDMKDIGSAITYARRYSLTMLLGIASEDDLDAGLFKDRAEAALGFAYTRAKKSVEEAKTTKDLDKALNVLQKELEAAKGGKAGALGLEQGQIEEIIKIGEARKVELEKGDKGSE